MQVIYDAREVNADALAYVRKESLDIYNRLHSIAEDVHFVQQVHEAYPDIPILRMYDIRLLTLDWLTCIA